MHQRYIPKRVVDLVGQCGLPKKDREDIISESGGLGFKRARCGVAGRYSQPLPMRSVYRITHIPPPPPTDSAKIYVNEHLCHNLENSKLDYSFHPTIHLNQPVTVYRPRLPILCMKEPLQDKLYQPSTYEERDLIEFPSEAIRVRTSRSIRRVENHSRPSSARTLSNSLLSPLEVHEPNFPSPGMLRRTAPCLSARSARPNSNSSGFSRHISMKPFDSQPIDPELIKRNATNSNVASPLDEPQNYYIEEKKNDEDEEKQPVNRRVLMIRRLLRGTSKDSEEDENEAKQDENANETQSEEQN